MNKKILNLILLIFLIGCDLSRPEIIKVNHYFGGSGFHLKYEIRNNSLTIKTNCDFEDCTEKIVYERKLSKTETKEFINKINLLEVDTLKNEYINKHILDGIYTEIQFGKLINTNKKLIIVQNENISSLDSLNNYIDELILENKYKLNPVREE
ncbi:hypothetical protein [Polaribacter marinivivus]|uniref:Lipoprotein n=1 Tax=Polaribacter marinivivus TaxID=1524260 RepID=A0ABV8R7G3_9FLAO